MFTGVYTRTGKRIKTGHILEISLAGLTWRAQVVRIDDMFTLDITTIMPECMDTPELRKMIVLRPLSHIIPTLNAETCFGCRYLDTEIV